MMDSDMVMRYKYISKHYMAIYGMQMIGKWVYYIYIRTELITNNMMYVQNIQKYVTCQQISIPWIYD
jgi:hypothetical protein